MHLRPVSYGPKFSHDTFVCLTFVMHAMLSLRCYTAPLRCWSKSSWFSRCMLVRCRQNCPLTPCWRLWVVLLSLYRWVQQLLSLPPKPRFATGRFHTREVSAAVAWQLGVHQGSQVDVSVCGCFPAARRLGAWLLLTQQVSLGAEPWTQRRKRNNFQASFVST